jgi:rhodanese-related sulfurtransferase
MRSGAALIDIRGDSQIARDGTIPGALVIARNVLEWRLDPGSQHRHSQAPGLGDRVILLCDEGYQSSLAAATLQELGFACATDVDGGFQAWREAGLPVSLPGRSALLTPAPARRLTPRSQHTAASVHSRPALQCVKYGLAACLLGSGRNCRRCRELLTTARGHMPAGGALVLRFGI